MDLLFSFFDKDFSKWAVKFDITPWVTIYHTNDICHDIFQFIISCFEEILQFQARKVCKWENVHLQRYVTLYQVINNMIIKIIIKFKNYFNNDKRTC